MSVEIASVQIGDNITFSLYGPIYPGKVNFSGKVISRLSADGLPPTAMAATDHVNVYRDLPPEIQETIEDSFTSYNYLLVKTNDGLFYIGEPWIIPGTLMLNNAGTATVTLGEFRDSDTGPLRQLLLANGYVVSSIVKSN